MADYQSTYTGQEIDEAIAKANTALQPETGKGLSTNDFSNEYKSQIDSNTSARHTHSNKMVLDGISSTDVTNWNNKSDFSGNYNDLTNKPNEVTETTVSNWGFTKNTGTYSKPSGGIPKNDLSSDVQTSLGKADTALQDISGKQDTLVSGTNIKSVNGESILGSGNIEARENLTHNLQNARYTTKCVTLAHFSDLHDDANALNRIVTKANSFGTLVDDIICTGDMVTDSARYYTSDGVTIDTSKAHNGSEGADFQNWWNPNVMTVIGNHDAATHTSGSGLTWRAISMADRDTYYISPFKSNWGITHTTGNSYYYKDYTSDSLRLIVIDTSLTSTDLTNQITWFTSLLSDAITNNLHVLVAAHSPKSGAPKVKCEFSDINAQDPFPTNFSEGCYLPQGIIDAVHTAQSNGLNFAGYLTGHIHKDAVYDCYGDKSQLAFGITCANTSAKIQWQDDDLYRSNTGNDDAFNIVTVDTTHSQVKIIRAGGADIDNKLRYRKVFTWDYANKADVSKEDIKYTVNNMHTTKSMVVTYDDNSTETFNIWCN